MLLLSIALAAEPLVVIPDGTALRVAPSDAAAAVRLDLRGPPDATFRLVGEQDGWVELGELTGDTAEGACRPGSLGNTAFELRFWVRSGELLRAGVEPLDLVVEGGGHLLVRAGIPVTAAEGGYVATQDGLVLHLPTSIRTGDRWAPPGPPDDRRENVRLDSALALGLAGGGHLELPAGRHSGRRSATESALVTRCWTLEFPPDAAAFATVFGVHVDGGMEGGVFGGIVSGSRPTRTWRIPKGAVARWDGGGEAGVTRRSVDVAAAVVREREDDVCIAYTGHPVESGDPQLCFARAAVTPPG